MSSKDGKYTIGVLVSGIMDEFSRYVCNGVLRVAKNMDVNVVVFPGKYIDRDLSQNHDLMYEYQYNTIFSFAKNKKIDALIIAAGSIGCFTSEMRMRKVFEQYEDMPCILVASKMEGYFNVVFDNYLGIKEGLEYLITKKNCSHFGMIGGNAENTDAAERRQTFEEVLRSHGIEVSEKMFVEGDLSRRSVAAARKLLDDNPEIEAIFCVNDDTALGLYEELKRRGKRPGKDIYVFGYDDTIMAAKISPSLSSVRADPSKLGEEAFKMALRQVAGEAVDNVIIPTYFVKRDSFSSEDTIQLQENGKDTDFQDIYYRYNHEDMREAILALKLSYSKMLKGLNKLYSKEEKNTTKKEVLKCVDEFIEHGGVAYADTESLMNFFEKLYRMLRKKLEGDKQLFELRDLFSLIYVKLIRAMNNKIGEMSKSQEQWNCELRFFVQDILQFEHGRDQSYASILANMEWLGIHDACIYTFEEPILHLDGEVFEVPDELYMKAVLQNGEVSIVSVLEQKTKIEDIYTRDFFVQEKGFRRVAFPLFFKEIIYGIFVCNMTENLYNNAEFLVNQISSSMKMISLLRINEQIQQQLEDNLVLMKKNNIQLDTLSKSDVLTGILNRRGFYSEAEQKIEESRSLGYHTLVVYVDMNNLKIINDRYGHEEGDYALKLIGRLLSELVGEQGIAGRIGGDEYAFVLEYDEEDEGKEVLQTLYAMFEQYNRTSDKPYNVTVSAGAYLLRLNQKLSLKEALMQADERLYEVKKFRKKEVEKKNI